MKRDLRIVFMGTPDFAVGTLNKLVENNMNIVGVITAPDKPAGRGRKLNSSAVKKYALENNLNILQPTNLKDENFLKELESLKANLQIIVAFRMLPKVVWSMPKYGTFNLHASLLPNYRGAAPIHWAIINGEKTTGVTTFFIDDKIDTGEILFKREVEIKENETLEILHDRLMDIGSELVIETVNKISLNEIQPIPQKDSTELKTAYKLNKDNCKIKWDLNLYEIHNKIRGLNPFPGAWCNLSNGENSLTAKIFNIEPYEEQHKNDFGSIKIVNKELKVYVKGGYIKILDLQLQNKKRMEIKSLLNGFSFTDNAQFY
jgi:methionyl-tRNA formyltransferase